MGLVPTHLDTHMGCLAQSEALIEVYLKMGQLYNLPVFGIKNYLPDEMLKKYDVKVLLDTYLMINPEDYANGSENYYINAIKNLKPGLTTILIHAGYNNDEMKGIWIDHPDFGSEWRQKDFDFFTSDTCKKLLVEENIKLVTWRQIKDALYSN